MKKLNSLRDHLLASPLKLQQDNLLIFAEQGQVISHQGQSNQNFELKYLANISITDFAGDVERVAYFILQWLDKHQPHGTTPLRFAADMLNHNTVNLSIAVELSEIIKVREDQQGIHLISAAEPELDQVLQPKQEWELTITHNPSGPPQQE